MNRGKLPTDPTVIVCVPTYNNGESIRSTLDILCSQSRPPDRIVVCDKSEDRTPEVIRSAANETEVSIEMIRQTGDGVAAAYDQLLDYVSGEYDLFLTLQTNIRVPNNWLATHLKVHCDNPSIDLVTGDRIDGRDEGGVGDRPKECEVTPDQSPYYVGRNFSAKPGVLGRIDGWDRNFLRGEDWDMRIRLAGTDTRVYTTQQAGWEWQSGVSDPTITLSKTKRRPTSLTFLAKYGVWYATFHPSHVIGDILSVFAVVFASLSVAFSPISPLLSMLLLLTTVCCVIPYVAGLAVLRGGVDDSLLLRPMLKQFLVGIGVCYAAHRLWKQDPDWNLTGFNPDNIPRYRY